MRPLALRQVVLSCLASLLLYAGVFGFVLDRPLSYGLLSDLIEAKLAHGAAIDGPKLVILAGSNGPYSHRCETIEPILDMPCVNGGVAVGIGLDYLFTRWDPLLRPGDVVYMPMEPSQYVRGRVVSALGPDAAILFRHDWTTLAKLPPRRWIAALFSFDARALVTSVIECGLLPLHTRDPAKAVADWGNPWGDHTGHTEALAAANQPMLAASRPWQATADQISGGYGTAEIARFVDRMGARGVRVVGGLSTGFADLAPSDNVVAAISSVYAGHGGRFLLLANHSLYPRTDFFDSAEHLHETAQRVHSRLVALALAQLLDRPVQLQALASPPR